MDEPSLPLSLMASCDHEAFIRHKIVRLGRFTRESVRLRFGGDTTEVGEFMVAKLTAEVLANRAEGRTRTYDFKSPSGRWQYFKMACFPGWALRRWPVRRDTTTITTECEHLATYPGADLAYIDDPMRAPVMVVRYRMNVDGPQ